MGLQHIHMNARCENESNSQKNVTNFEIRRLSSIFHPFIYIISYLQCPIFVSFFVCKGRAQLTMLMHVSIFHLLHFYLINFFVAIFCSFSATHKWFLTFRFNWFLTFLHNFFLFFFCCCYCMCKAEVFN